METIQKTTDTRIKGTEVLFFEDVTLCKTKNGKTSFSSLGSLSVLYLEDYHRFMLHLNDWRYPLMRRITIRGTGHEGSSHTYELPARNGFTYTLRINNVPNQAILLNFEHILNSNSNFTAKDTVNTEKQRESSPTDKVSSDYMKEGMMITDKVKEVLKHSFDKLKNVTKSSKMKTENLTSRKKRIDLKTLKNKNFRRTARSTFKKDFFTEGEKRTREFLDMRRSNPTNLEVRDTKELSKPKELMGPTVYLRRMEVEEAIVMNREMMNKGTTTTTQSTNLMGQKSPEKKGILQTLKHGFNEIKESVTEFMGMGNTQERGREMNRDERTGTERTGTERTDRTNVQQQTMPTTTQQATMHYEG